MADDTAMKDSKESENRKESAKNDQLEDTNGNNEWIGNVKGTTSNVFNSALEFWTQLDLPSLQKRLDDQGIEIKDDSKNSLMNRKNLATKTKDFKKLDDSEKLEQFKSLLKAYQNEIDLLTNRLKKVENYFFQFYRSIVEAPDPKPLLEISLNSVIELAEISNYKQEIQNLNEQLSKRADYDQLKLRLLRNEQKSAELLSNKLKAKEEEFKALIDEKQSNWSEKEKLYQKQLNDYKKSIEELKTSKEVTELQLNSQNSHQNELNSRDNSTLLAELDIVSRDAEFSKQRLLEVEKRNEDLRRELSVLKNNLQIDNLKEEFHQKISSLESENVLLIAELEQSRKTIANLTTENANKIKNLTNETHSLSNEIKNLRAALDKTKDYDEIKAELQFLRKIEFDAFDEDEDIANANSSTTDNDIKSNKDNDEIEEDFINKTKNKVETMLIQKNKSLNNELINYRSQYDSLMSKINDLESQINTSNTEIDRLTKLNNKLEEDLLKFDNPNNFNDSMSLISGMTKRPGTIITNPTSSLPAATNNGFNNNSNGTTGSSEDSSILPIITKQRDRFRDRNNELDNELKKQYAIVNDLKRTVNRLKQDNEELYERTRYLALSVTSNNSSRLVPRPNVDLESNYYRSNYESKLHPIEQFRIKEQERISSRLSPFERIFISLTRAILATRATRMLFLFYCVGLHLIVMMTTIYSTSLHSTMIPEVGINTSTGGQAQAQAQVPP